jgi:nucleotide-binding universal stress UspA family protein
LVGDRDNPDIARRLRVYESIVVGVDGSETAGRAITEAIGLAEAVGATLHVVSGYEEIRGAKIVGAPKAAAKVWGVAPDAQGRKVVEEAEAKARLRGVSAKSHAVKGDATEALLKVAERENADLIVVGSRGMHGVSRLLGSVPDKVSHKARCNVLIVATEEG